MNFLLNKKGIDSYIFTLRKRLNYIKNQFSIELKKKLEENSPKRTGKLASSYILVPSNYSISIFNVCGYCKFVNDGTRFQSGQHFIEQSYFETMEKLNLIVKNSTLIS